MLKRLLLTTVALTLTLGAALAQTHLPAAVGTLPTTTPQKFDLQDNTGTWVPFGTVDPATHVFSSSILSHPNTWTGAQTIKLGSTGVFVGDSAGLLTQSTAKTAYSIYSTEVPPGWFLAGVTRSVLDQEPGTTVQGTAAFDSYVWNNTPQGANGNQANAVGLSAVGVGVAAHSATWGINTTLDDSYDNTLGHSVPAILVSYEADCTTYNAGSICNGLAAIMQGSTQANGDAFSVSSVGPVARWSDGVVINAGSVKTGGYGVIIGATANTGTTLNSNTLALGLVDTSGAGHYLTLSALANGVLQIVATNDYVNGILIQPNQTGKSAQIFAGGLGSDANIGMVIATKGSGQFNFIGSVQEMNFAFNSAVVPSDPSGMTPRYNFTGGGAETDFFNDLQGAVKSFNFYQVTVSGSAATLLASLSPVGALTLTAGVTAALPASAGTGGLAVCVDSAGVFYKKAACP